MSDTNVTPDPIVIGPTTVIPSDGHEREMVLWILALIAGLCVIGLSAIGVFSIQLQLLTTVDKYNHIVPSPREAGASVGALRENIMSVLSGIVGALIMKAKGSNGK